MNKVIQRALEIVGSQKRLADIAALARQWLRKWLYGGSVSPKKVTAIVNATGGEIKAHEIRPDLPDLFPHPENHAA